MREESVNAGHDEVEDDILVIECLEVGRHAELKLIQLFFDFQDVLILKDAVFYVNHLQVEVGLKVTNEVLEGVEGLHFCKFLAPKVEVVLVFEVLSDIQEEEI